ncbi:MAG TPA: SAM-dependent methyltransferase [Streptosporangiaceae bacterium]|nr:SAM-dependent methyltransferase [Streptosporangiaceae bacterium]
MRQPLAILTEAARTLDFGRPVAVTLTAILHLIQDAEGRTSWSGSWSACWPRAAP